MTYSFNLSNSFLVIVFLQVTLYLHFLWIGPLQAVTVLFLLMYAIGPSCLAGMAVFFVLLPVQIMFGRLFSSLRFVAIRQMYQILITVACTYERFLLCVALVPLLQVVSAVVGLKQQS